MWGVERAPPLPLPFKPEYYATSLLGRVSCWSFKWRVPCVLNIGRFLRVLKKLGEVPFDETWGYVHKTEVPSDTGMVCDWSSVSDARSYGKSAISRYKHQKAPRVSVIY